MNPTVVIENDSHAVTVRATQIVAERTRKAIAARGRFAVALSGGSTVGEVFESWATQPDIDWTKVFLFWGDDRFVDRTNPYSAYKLASEKLLRNTPRLPPANVFPVPVDAPNPTAGAKLYSDTVRRFFGLSKGEWPRFDLTINGMGPDGHTASLFPRSAALGKTDRIAAMNHAGLAPWVDRVTLTFPVFNHARCVLFIATGAAKAKTVKAILEGPQNVRTFPSQGVRPTDGELIWLLDAAIAAELSTAATSANKS